ncbi:hypothetical protein BH23PLA1_BH23PLA1_14360 [soil metagenome]
MADVDGDGWLDLLTGSDDCCDHEPGFYWFRREENGRFTAQPKVHVQVADGEVVLFMSRFRVALADWDSDSRPDLIVSATNLYSSTKDDRPSSLYISEGAWSVAGGEVAAPRPVEGAPEHLLQQPCVVDWDGDGRPDLITRTSTYQGGGRPFLSSVRWQRNIAGEGERGPRLAEPQVLLELPEGEGISGLSAADWNGDGQPDLIVGYYRGGRTAADRASGNPRITGVRVYPRVSSPDGNKGSNSASETGRF